MSKVTYTEKDLNLLILDKLDTQEECAQYPNICQMMQTEAGTERVFNRVKEVILNDGNTSVESAIAVVETELIFTQENDQ